MKYLLSLTAIFLTLISCTNENQMNLSGNISGLKKGTILLQKVVDTSLVALDSMVVDGDSSFSFSDIVESPEVYYLYVRLKDEEIKDNRIAFFAEPGDITIQSNLENLALDAKITGSQNQTLFGDYKKLIERYNDRNLDLIEETFHANVAGNDSLVQVLTNKQLSNINSKYLATVNFAMNNNDTELAPYLVISEIYDANIPYLDTVYKKLTPRIQESKYGKALDAHIKERKAAKDQ